MSASQSQIGTAICCQSSAHQRFKTICPLPLASVRITVSCSRRPLLALGVVVASSGHDLGPMGRWRRCRTHRFRRSTSAHPSASGLSGRRCRITGSFRRRGRRYIWGNSKPQWLYPNGAFQSSRSGRTCTTYVLSPLAIAAAIVGPPQCKLQAQRMAMSSQSL